MGFAAAQPILRVSVSLFRCHRHQSFNGFAVHKNGLVMIIGKEDADHVRAGGLRTMAETSLPGRPVRWDCVPGTQFESSRLHHAFRRAEKFPAFAAKVAFIGPLLPFSHSLFRSLETGTTAKHGFLPFSLCPWRNRFLGAS